MREEHIIKRQAREEYRRWLKLVWRKRVTPRIRFKKLVRLSATVKLKQELAVEGISYKWFKKNRPLQAKLTHINPVSTKPKLHLTNVVICVEHGYVYKKSSSRAKRILRIIEKNSLKVGNTNVERSFTKKVRRVTEDGNAIMVDFIESKMNCKAWREYKYKQKRDKYKLVS